MSEPALTVKQAAEALSVHPRTVYRMIDANEIQAGKVRGAIRISPDAIRQILAPGENTAQDCSGVGLDVRGENQACQQNAKQKTVSTGAATRRSGGAVTSIAAVKGLADLLAPKSKRKLPRSSRSGD